MRTPEMDSWLSQHLKCNLGAVATAVVDTFSPAIEEGENVVGAVGKVVGASSETDMQPDCKPVKGKVPGPVNHLLCSSHGHILDVSAKKIIAKDLADYKAKGLGGHSGEHAQGHGNGGTHGALDGAVHGIGAPPGSAMQPDCKPVKGKVPGPANHLLCEAHGHILDVGAKKIIAADLAEYKAKGLGGTAHGHGGEGHGAQGHAQGHAPVQANGHAEPTPPAPPTPSATTAPAPTGPDPAKVQADVKKIIALAKIEVEDIQFLQGEYERVTGGGRLNRAISWISDKVGGADDPKDELDEIAGKLAVLNMNVIGLAGAMRFDEAYRNIAQMKEMNNHARSLWMKYTGDTIKGAERTVTGLEVASKAGDIATMGLNVVAPGAGKILSVTKTVAVTGSKLAFGEKVNWAEVTIDMVFDLFVGGEGSNPAKLAEKVGGPLAKKLAPKITEELAKRWGEQAIAKKLGAEFSKEAVEKYLVAEVEEQIKDHAKELVKSTTEKVVEAAKDTDVTTDELFNRMINVMTNPAGSFATMMTSKVEEKLKP